MSTSPAPLDPEVTRGESKGADVLTSPVRRALVDVLAHHRDVHRPQQPGREGRPGNQASGPPGPPGLTAAELGERLDRHPTTIRFHLDQLVEAGLISASFSHAYGVGRPRKVYAIAETSFDDVEPESSLQLLAELLVETFADQPGTPAEVGERWARANVPRCEERSASAGQWLSKLGQLVDVLHVWGYTPDLTTSDGGRAATIDLVACPFLPLAHSNPAVVCGIHRGLLRGALDQLGETEAELSLLPFVGPELCQVQLRATDTFDPHPIGDLKDRDPSH